MKRALVILALVAVASGCVHAGDSPQENPMEPANDTIENANNTQNGASTEGVESSDTSGEEHTVYYTSEGFQPQEITIEQGDTVTWINNASQAMWVGSNNHPSHTQYDGTSTYRHCNGGSSNTFDQCSEGDEYSFTFDKTGEWGYHNHRSAFDEGTVIVE